MADEPAFQLSCAVRRDLFSSAIRATGLVPDVLYEEVGQRGYAHATLLQLTQSCILKIIFPENASALVTHLQYTLCPWLANQRVLWGAVRQTSKDFFWQSLQKDTLPWTCTLFHQGCTQLPMNLPLPAQKESHFHGVQQEAVGIATSH